MTIRKFIATLIIFAGIAYGIYSASCQDAGTFTFGGAVIRVVISGLVSLVSIAWFSALQRRENNKKNRYR